MRLLLRRGVHLEFKIIRALLNLIAIFRVFRTGVKPSIGTVIAPFDGVVKTFDKSILTAALKDLLKDLTIQLSKPKGLVLESAGPNSFKSTWTAPFDLFALIDIGKF